MTKKPNKNGDLFPLRVLDYPDYPGFEHRHLSSEDRKRCEKAIEDMKEMVAGAPPMFMLERPYLARIYGLGPPKTKILKARATNMSSAIPERMLGGPENMSLNMAEAAHGVTTGRTQSSQPNIANRPRTEMSMEEREMTGACTDHNRALYGAGDGCPLCMRAQIQELETRVKELSYVGYEYTCRDGHTETETFETEEVGDAYAEMRFRKEVAEAEIEKLRADKGLEAFECPHCGGPWQARNGKCIHCWVNEADVSRSAIQAEVAALDLIIDPPAPPPDAVPISNFGSAGAGMVASHWEEWARSRKAVLEEALK